MAKILIVGDEPQIVRLLSAVLTRAGHEVHTAGGVQEALNISAPPVSFDIVLCDVDMPLSEGHDVVRQIASRRPDIRVMLMSAFDSPYPADPCAPPLIRKPFAPAEVVRGIAELLALPMK